MQTDFDVIVAGGGLAGLITALELLGSGQNILVIEKGHYPRHKVCGEYISGEVIPYLKKLNILSDKLKPVKITHFQMSSPGGQMAKCRMSMGGIGISRYVLDDHLYNLSIERGADVLCGKEVREINFHKDIFTVGLKSGETFTSKVVIGAFGKRSRLDHTLNRNSATKRTSFIAVKQHYKYKLPSNTVALHNFSGGYCGLSKVEDDKINMCYLARKEDFMQYNDLDSFARNHLSQNHYLKTFFEEAEPLMKEPLVISQLNFERKEVVENNILMTGDAAALIHPLCGNGMAMAIHSAKICAEQVKLFLEDRISRTDMEWNYQIAWEHQFDGRLRFGQGVQNFFGRNTLSGLAVRMARVVPYLLQRAVRLSHGRVIRS